MTSLRRPSAAMPGSRNIPQASTARPPLPDDAVKKRDVRKSKVGEKIKKRLSMRYAGSPSVSAPPPMPFSVSAPREMRKAYLENDSYVPSAQLLEYDDETIDDGIGASRFGEVGAGAPEDEKIVRRGAADMSLVDEWDLEDLAKEGIDVQAFLRKATAGASDEELGRFRAAIERRKQQTAKDLQRNVFKNYAEFVVMSKEISTLESDIMQLKELLTEWKAIPQLLGMDDSAGFDVDRRRTYRNSIMDLQSLYRDQLTTLWSTIEGSQKFLPLVPGRHLVCEASNFVELNAATYKVKQSVELFLLNDLLLVAGRRRKRGESQSTGDDRERARGRLVAERCWMLSEVVVVDVKDSGDLTNAIKIRRGKETFVYRTSRSEDKKALLAAFRQVAEELAARKRKDSEKEQERRKSLWQGDMSVLGATPPMPNMMSPSRPLSTVSLSGIDSKDSRWIEEFGDELTMSIAVRAWDEAVALVERGHQHLQDFTDNQSGHDLMSARLSQLTPTLINQLCYDLSSSMIRKTSAAYLVQLLIRLDQADEARDTFLKARQNVLIKRVRSIKFEGDISLYISELAIVTFTIIKHTSEWFMVAFKESRMASGLVAWARQQVEEFAERFRRQVYSPSVSKQMIEESVKVVATQNRKILRDAGLDFTYLLATLLQPNFADADVKPHPIFTAVSSSNSTPYAGETPMASSRTAMDTPAVRTPGSTAPLAFAPRSPKRAAASPAPSKPDSPRPPPRSERRVRAPPRISGEDI